jgi:hypothetical protein
VSGVIAASSFMMRMMRVRSTPIHHARRSGEIPRSRRTRPGWGGRFFGSMAHCSVPRRKNIRQCISGRRNDLETTLGQCFRMTGTSDAPACLPTMDTDRETRELRALCEQFKQTMQQQTDVPLFDSDAKVRLGQMIGRAALGSSEYGYPSRR